MINEAVSTTPTRALDVRRFLTQWWVAFAASSILVVSGHLLIKSGLNAANHGGRTGISGILHSVMQVEVVLGLAVYLFGSVCWMIAVAQRDISFLYPLSSVNYVLVVITSALMFADHISPRRGAGVSLIVLGMILMNRNSERQAQNGS